MPEDPNPELDTWLSNCQSAGASRAVQGSNLSTYPFIKLFSIPCTFLELKKATVQEASSGLFSLQATGDYNEKNSIPLSAPLGATLLGLPYRPAGRAEPLLPIQETAELAKPGRQPAGRHGRGSLW